MFRRCSSSRSSERRGWGSSGRFPWAERVARLASFVTLALGLALVTALVVAASYLSGIYGAVGRGGAVILVLVSALALPYLVALPVSQLLWLGPSPLRAPAPHGGGARAEPGAAVKEKEPA